MHELSREFWFEAAHLPLRGSAAEGSTAVHGHSYRAEIVVRGVPDNRTGMVTDLVQLDEAVEDIQWNLDHTCLNAVADLEPTTIENLARWIWRRLAPRLENLTRITVYRENAGEACSYLGPEKIEAMAISSVCDG